MSTLRKLGARWQITSIEIAVIAVIIALLGFSTHMLYAYLKADHPNRFVVELGFPDGSVLYCPGYIEHEQDPAFLCLARNKGPVRVFKLPKPELISQEAFRELIKK